MKALVTSIVVATFLIISPCSFAYNGSGGGNVGGGGSGMTASAIFMPSMPLDITDI
ncbi:hypothetical protein OAK75_13580 [Bacteriovoracales bacterium]|nr:hypothetical protein [Bacteriovoracales bacterium]